MYLYLYSYWMPEEIRKFVDLTFNCDDLALNFLIAHVSRKPPMKVSVITVVYQSYTGEPL